MKWGIFIVFLLILITLISSNAVVLSAGGIEGFEAYQQALYAVGDVVGEAMNGIIGVVREAGKIIVELFEIAIEAEP